MFDDLFPDILNAISRLFTIDLFITDSFEAELKRVDSF
jgi:hypothetical protein